VLEVNALQKRRVVTKLKQRLGALHGKKVALLGLTFKPNTDDLREASSIVLAARLQGEGVAVSAYDPMIPAGEHALFPGLTIVADPLEALSGADAAVLVTEWPEFGRLDWSAAAVAMRRPLVIDGRNFLSPAVVSDAGLEYDGIGLGDASPDAGEPA
jgi:UDPglucose 6-dehydrogenase